jgi:hypothetical protein
MPATNQAELRGSADARAVPIAHTTTGELV